MKTFAKLEVKGQSSQVQSLSGALDAALRGTPGWRRDLDKERWLAEHGGASLRCYARDPSEERAGALVWLDVTGDTLRVTNITPATAGSLSIDEYNALVRDLHHALSPTAKVLDSIEVKFDDGEDAFRGRLTNHVAQLLNEFAVAANRAGEASHPHDRERWLKFLLAAHREHASLSADLLAQWLREEHDFPFDVAERLAEEYEHGRELLRLNEADAA